jgi:hypothetical protein
MLIHTYGLDFSISLSNSYPAISGISRPSGQAGYCSFCRNDFTGFATAAFMAWKLTVKNAMLNAITAVSAKPTN